MGETVLSHLPLLVSLNPYAAERHCAAKQDIPGRFIRGEICVGMIVLHSSLEEASSAGKAAALVTDCGQRNLVRCGGIPDVLGFSAIEAAETLGCLKRDQKPPFCHTPSMRLRVIKTPILAVRRLTRFAAAEVT